MLESCKIETIFSVYQEECPACLCLKENVNYPKENYKIITLIPSCDAKKKSIFDNVVICVSTKVPAGILFSPMLSFRYSSKNLVL